MTAHAPTQRRFLNTRHPICPYCDYDLVATVADNRRICPECGESFEPGDLRYQPIPGDFTPAVAFRRTLAAMLVRAFKSLLVFLPAMGALLLAATLGKYVLLLAVLFVTPFIGVWIGRIFARNLEEVVGYSGIILFITTCASLSVTIITGDFVACMLAPQVAWPLFNVVTVCALVISNAYTIHHLWRDMF
ncbi:MAG TPA: hypothetical protein VG711_05050 [Phycisphaerales bacterium]|nr:hypothetical protein [Phycisphaerales bacterium]